MFVFIQSSAPKGLAIREGAGLICRTRTKAARAHVATQQRVAEHSRTERIFEDLKRRQLSDAQAGGAGGGTTYEALKGADSVWAKVRSTQAPPPAPVFVTEDGKVQQSAPEYDVIMCGGTLGVFLATALLNKGFSVAIIERAALQGREQEWNISRKELQELVLEGILEADEAEQCVSSEFNPVRAGFHGGQDVWTENVLNLGVRPDWLIDKVRRRFEQKGGKILEKTAAEGVVVHPNAVELRLGGNRAALTGRLLIDCMGNASPLVRQLRRGQKPDGICCVVGTCSRGFKDNSTGDVIYTNTPIQGEGRPQGAGTRVQDVQYFWEAFPAGSGPTDRTTYMFAYMDAQPSRPSLETMLEDYWELMPEYQGVKLEDLEVLRILFGFFPTYRASPLKPGWNRTLQIGDASGIQSPLSFGGFGALMRHLPRLRGAITEALQADALDRSSLASINAYSPGLSGAWMLQRAMSVRPGRPPKPEFINSLLGSNFASMERNGDATLKPFLQDVVQFVPLSKTLFGQVSADPSMIPQILKHVGPVPLLDWTRHYIALGLYSVLNRLAAPLLRSVALQLPARQQFAVRRTAEAWEYGSGGDYQL